MDARFVEAGIDEDVDVDGVWEWLTLYYFDTTCPVRGDGRRVKKPNRYVLNPSSEVDPRRHLLRNAYLVHRRMGLRDPRAVDLIMSQRVDDYAKDVQCPGLASRTRRVAGAYDGKLKRRTSSLWHEAAVTSS